MTKAFEELDLAAKLLPELGCGSLGIRIAELFEVENKAGAQEMLLKSETNGVKVAGLAADIQRFLKREKMSDLSKPDVKGENGPIVSKPRLRRPPRPLYPVNARENGEQGLVVLEIIVGRGGALECARAVKGLSYGLTEAALSLRGERSTSLRLRTENQWPSTSKPQFHFLSSEIDAVSINRVRLQLEDLF